MAGVRNQTRAAVNLLESAEVICPYCGETIEILIDRSLAEQSYIEDCSVCCRPITIEISDGMGQEFNLAVKRDDE